MLAYPEIDPVAFSAGPIAVYWYGIMYLLAFFIRMGFGVYRCQTHPSWNKAEVTDMLFYGVLGVIVGGRVGYILFYQFAAFLHDPLMIVRIWQGGMSFHGGLLGVFAAMGLFAKKSNKTFFDVMDFLAPLVPIGLGLGRIGNFINGELWGRVTEMPWGMVFPSGGVLMRHPSQLYQAFFEGVILFSILWIYSSKPRARMKVSGMFLLWYGILRIIAEMFREPDVHLGFVFLHNTTMGQWLSLPMVLGGIFLLYWGGKRAKLS